MKTEKLCHLNSNMTRYKWTQSNEIHVVNSRIIFSYFLLNYDRKNVYITKNSTNIKTYITKYE